MVAAILTTQHKPQSGTVTHVRNYVASAQSTYRSESLKYRMAESHVVSALVKKRARLMGELAYHLEAVKRLESAVDATGQSIKIFDPSYRISAIKPIRCSRNRYFKQGECTRLVLDVLRESGEPMDTAAVVAEVVRLKPLDPDEVDMRAVNQSVVNVLKGLVRRGIAIRVDSGTWSVI